MTAIIDADTFVWVAAYLNRDNPPVDEAVNSHDGIDTEGLVATRATQYAGYVQVKEKSYRHKMFNSYKANRPPKPIWLQRFEKPLKLHLLEYWKFTSVEGLEADDAVASCAYRLRELGQPYIVVGNDKDLNQIPGDHYNPQKKEKFHITSQEAEMVMYLQLLTGDSTDNIKGVPGVGPAKAKKILTANTIAHCGFLHAIMTAY